MKKTKQITERSNCCNYRVKVVGRTTLHYECCKCHQACDVHFVERHIWIRNPVTQITPNKKDKLKEVIEKKELLDYENHE